MIIPKEIDFYSFRNKATHKYYNQLHFSDGIEDLTQRQEVS